MPFKDFTTEILTSADVDLYLMSQVIIRCTSGTRPLSPAQGWHIYETDTSRFLVYNGSAWVQEGSVVLSAYKSADESITSTTALQDDNHLFVSVEANTAYLIDLFFLWHGSGNAIRVGWSYPSGTTGTYVPMLGGNFASQALGTAAKNADVYTITPFDISATYEHGYGIGPTDISGALIKGTIITSSTAGTFRFRWAQSGTGSASLATVVKAHSNLKLTKVA